MFNILTYNKIAKQGLNAFDSNKYKVKSKLDNPEAIFLRSYNLNGQPIPESVLCIARAGAGINNIPLEACNRRGVVVFNTPGANANAVMELVLSGMLIASRNIDKGIHFIRQLDLATHDASTDTSIGTFLEGHKKQFSGFELRGKTMGVIGLGNIGALVANMSENMGMKVLGYDPVISVEAAWRLSQNVVKMDSMESLIKASNFVSLHVPANESNHHLINKNNLKLFKEEAILLNFSREQVVDSEALLKAIASDQLYRYVTDFPAAEMINNSAIIPLPHIGASTLEAETNCAVMAADQLQDFLENGNIVNSVNFPTSTLPRIDKPRLTFSNQNVPNVLSQVLATLGDINVLEMLNKSRDDIAYNLMDLETIPDRRTFKAIKNIKGIIRVRLIS